MATTFSKPSRPTCLARKKFGHTAGRDLAKDPVSPDAVARYAWRLGCEHCKPTPSDGQRQRTRAPSRGQTSKDGAWHFLGVNESGAARISSVAFPHRPRWPCVDRAASIRCRLRARPCGRVSADFSSGLCALAFACFFCFARSAFLAGGGRAISAKYSRRSGLAGLDVNGMSSSDSSSGI